MTLSLHTAATALDALGNPTRLTAFRLLVQAGPAGLTPSALAGEVGMTPAAMSFHLKDLLKAQLIQQRHEGRQIFYSARYETMNGLVSFLTENCCGGNVCMPARVPSCSDEGACS